MSGRRWTAEEDALVRALPARRGACVELAARLERSVPSVRHRRGLLGLAKKKRRTPPWTAELEAEYRRLHAEGLSDQEVADRWCVHRQWLNAHRRRLGLASNRSADHLRGRMREQCRRQVAAAGVATLADLMHRRRRQFAARYGLPAELQPRAVMIVLALAAGPMTKSQICAAVGLSWRPGRAAQKCLNAGKGRSSYLTVLRALALVASSRIPGVGGGGPAARGREQTLYALTPLALSLLSHPPSQESA